MTQTKKTKLTRQFSYITNKINETQSITFIKYILSMHLTGLFILSILRIALYVTNNQLLSATYTSQYYQQSIAFIRGVWFDNVISCYISALPLVVALFMLPFHSKIHKVTKPITIYYRILFGIAFAVSAANIPYFKYFFKNINSSIFNWFEYGATTMGMMFSEPSYYPAILLFILSIILYVYSSKRFTSHFTCLIKSHSQSQSKSLSIACLAINATVIFLCFFGIRGRMGYNPIKVSAAYYCEDPFLNQLGVNASFILLTTTLDEMRPENKYLHLMNENLAIKETKQLLDRPGIDGISPIASRVKNDSSALFKNKPNIVIIFMESMSANLMQTFGQQKRITPFLDSLFQKSISFTNAYSAGIHTNHGVYATLYSFPALMKRNLMKGSDIPIYSGLPTILKENGYHNMFFMTHESQYDNMNAFFRTNGYHEIFAQEDYPKDKVANSFGVQDDFLYEYAINKLNERSHQRQPFFATILSISNHPPYVIPEKFHPQYKEKEDQIVEYADWALKNFFNEARKQPWFENTIFVLEADHGKLVGKAENEMPQSYNHIPLMFYSPLLKPERRTDWATQMDIQPTLLGMLGIDYIQNNFGVDLTKGKRPFVFYTADNFIAARTKNNLYMYCPESKQEFMYRISDNNMKRVTSMDNDFKNLKEYLFCMLQSTEYLVRSKKTINVELRK